MKTSPVSRKDFSHCSGFNIVELIIVLTMVAFLATILLAVFSGIQDSARSNECKVHLRQIGLSMEVYASDHNGIFFPYYDTQGEKIVRAQYWMRALQDYHQGYDELLSVIRCPQTSFTPHSQPDPPSTGSLQPITSYPTVANSGWGTVDRAWGKQHDGSKNPEQLVGYSGSYTFNSWFYSGTDVKGSVHEERNVKHYFKSMDGLSKPSETPFFSDGIYVDTRIFNDVGNYSPKPKHTLGATFQIGRIYINRHDAGINMGYADGRVDQVNLERLWDQQWNALSQPKDNPAE